MLAAKLHLNAENKPHCRLAVSHDLPTPKQRISLCTLLIEDRQLERLAARTWPAAKKSSTSHMKATQGPEELEETSAWRYNNDT